ncbi:MAG: hypothetical protein WC678_03485 [Parcubacteria group bacterium]|jgi:hypothetical protein
MKFFFKFILIILIPTILASAFYFAKADDEGDEGDDDYKPQTTTRTVVAQPSVSTKVETTTKTTIYKDSDGDGILDETDPHPEIAEIYIVEDNNKNGIVDKFE